MFRMWERRMSFKVIDGDGPGKEERDREWAKHEFS